jgi:hypothetical protein
MQCVGGLTRAAGFGRRVQAEHRIVDPAVADESAPGNENARAVGDPVGSA